MFGRVSNEVNIGSTVAADHVTRADLSVGSSTSGAEIPGQAVPDVSKSQSIQKELPPHIHEKAKIIGILQNEMNDLESRAAIAKELEGIRAKLLLGHKDASDGLIQSQNVKQAFQSTNNISAIEFSLLGHTQSNKHEKDQNIVGQADQKRIIGRIDDALMVVDKLLGEIDSKNLATNRNFLNLTGWMTGLNAARSTVDSTQLSLSVAINAADMILTNVKAAIVSHGKINTDLVRLVMN